MIKRIQFVTRRRELSASEFPAAWVAAVARVSGAPAGARPMRAVACTTLHDVSGTEAPHDGISMEWFVDIDALRRFEAWLSAEDGQLAASAAAVIEQDATVVIIAGEVVMRGASWLERRWADGNVKLKHMALARRAEGLSPAEFSERWRNRPGKIGGGSAPVIVIPDEAKGYAYVQNHPIASIEQEWRYDAVNEVYFDDLESMRRRIEFFRTNDVGRVDADLVSEATFVAVSEHLVASHEGSSGT